MTELLERFYGRLASIIGAVVLIVSCLSISEVAATGYVGTAAWNANKFVAAAVVIAISIALTCIGGLFGVAITDMIFFFLMTVLGVGLQLAIPAFCVELFAESLAVLGVVMFVENEDEFIDTEIGVHNRQALKMTLDSLTALKKPFCVLAVRVSTVEAFSRVDKTIITQNAMASTANTAV